MEKIVLIGSGGHAKSVLDSIVTGGCWEAVGFISERFDNSFQYRNLKIIGTDDDLQKIFETQTHYAFISIGYMGNSAVREKLFNKLKDIGYNLPIIIDPSAIIAADVLIGEGTYIGKGAIINANVKIGKMAIINSGAIVEHDCIIGDYTHIAVNASCCGGVIIGNNSFIGAGTTLLQSIKISNRVIVGAGSTILAGVAPNQTVYGVYKG